MKHLARLLSIALIIVMVFSLTGCAKARLKGKWEAEEDGVTLVMEFDKDEVTLSMGGFETSVEYEVKGNKLIIEDEETEFKFKGFNTLILNPGEDDEVEYKRK